MSQGKTCSVDKPYLENSWFGTRLVPRDQTGRAQMQVVILVPRLNNLGTRPQERSILCSRAQCMRMSSIDMGLDYDSTVMLTCKLLFAGWFPLPQIFERLCASSLDGERCSCSWADIAQAFRMSSDLGWFI